MSQFQKNRFYFSNTVVFTLLVLLSLGAKAERSDNDVVVQSISQEEQNAALKYWTPERNGGDTGDAGTGYKNDQR